MRLIQLHSIAVCAVLWNTSCAQRFIAVPASSRYYGQDGPWGAVSVNYGGYPQGQLDESQWATVDLFPGGQYNSFVISPTACRGDSTGLCGLGGNVSAANVNQTIDGLAISFRPYSNYSADSGINMTGNVYEQTMNVGFGKGGAGYTAYNTSAVIVDEMNYTAPDHQRTNAVEVGYLALGAGDASGGSPTQGFSTGGREKPILAWNLPGYFWKHNLTPSFTYTLQVDAAAFEFPLSLIFGGYDMGRLIGPVTTFQSQLSLLDIGIGVQTGGSPFSFATKSGLLLDSGGNNRPIRVIPDPQGPYVSLPRQTCDVIASLLPVKFDSSGYYLWQTDDPSYAKIVSSPAYLSFTFPPPPGNSTNVVLKLPFLLLNLTLGPLLSGLKAPVPYFPCMPYTPDSGAPYILGRAFLQSAFLGRNWNTAVSWLAQAPGPGPGLQGLGTSYQDIASDQVALNTFAGNADEQFNSTWTDYWKPLPDDLNSTEQAEASTSTATSTHRESLSTGTQAGIGAGAGVVVLALGSGLAIFCWRKRKSSKTSGTTYLQPSVDQGTNYDLKGSSPLGDFADNSKCPSYYSLKELATSHSPPNAQFQKYWPPVELPARQDPQELGLRSPRRP